MTREIRPVQPYLAEIEDPSIVRDFQRVIGDKAREQILTAEGCLPDVLVACVGGGSNAIGLFYPFLRDKDVRLVGVEAGGKGIESGRHAARFADPTMGRLGVLHETQTYVLQNPDGQIALTHSISAGLDIDSIFLLAPTSEDGRVRLVVERASGFLYLVSLTGVTGARDRLPPDLESFVARVRPVTDLPLAVGFGISTPDQAAQVARMADGVIVGSALIKAIGAGKDAAAASAFIASLRAGIDKNQLPRAPTRF